MKHCSIQGCENKVYARTWCSPHYKRWLKTGDVRADEPLGRYSAAQTERMSEKLRGRKHGPRPEQWRRNISAAKKGKSNGREGISMPTATRAKIGVANASERNGGWKGERVGYVALHERVRKQLPHECAHCGSTERLEAALRKDSAGALVTSSMLVAGKERAVRHSLLASDYMRLCVPCHRVYDLGKAS